MQFETRNVGAEDLDKTGQLNGRQDTKSQSCQRRDQIAGEPEKGTRGQEVIQSARGRTPCGLKEQRDTQQICKEQTVLAVELDRL
ncbi:hypothetical protein BY996DRAFT_6600548 [Phakopsora pachyrhizi]|nr:hypothetical protein BY996DRAFT_6600548 [Phakopsora pachyrhizi]